MGAKEFDVQSNETQTHTHCIHRLRSLRKFSFKYMEKLFEISSSAHTVVYIILFRMY